MSIKSRSVAVVSVGVLLAIGALVWFWMGGEGIVGETLAIQRQLLNGEVSGRDRQAGLRLITRNVDRMDRDDVQAVRAALTADWRRMQQAGIEEYFAADGGDQEALLDRQIGRLVTAGDLWFATNPRSSGMPPRPRPKAKNAADPPKTRGSPAVQLFESYLAAIQVRARERGISLPVWLLNPPKR